MVAAMIALLLGALAYALFTASSNIPLLFTASAASIAPFVGGLLYETTPYLPFYLVIGVLPLLAILALSKTFQEEKPAPTAAQ